MDDGFRAVERGAAFLDAQRAAHGGAARSLEERAQRMMDGVLEPGGPMPETDDEAIERLAALSPLEYERTRAIEAKRMGVRASSLDRMVAQKRQGEQATDGIGFDDVEPWPETVAGDALLSEIATTVQRFIVCKPETAQAAALWVAMTWLIDTVQVAPLAVITAPEKRCGKSQLLTFLGNLSCRPMQAASISTAALYRVIEAWKPTLMVDEADAFMRDNEELRGILNSGHTRDSAYVIRTVGDDHTPKRFSTWGAKAIAAIGKLADTLMDRAIILSLRRKLPHEDVERLRYADPGLFDEFASRLCRWAEDNREAVRRARPELPQVLNDRAQDNWEPLLAIADIAGGPWPETARKTAIAISGGADEAGTIGGELLADILEVFETKRIERLGTKELIEALCADDEKPWSTYNRGKWISPRQVSSRLKGYGISPKNIRIGYAVSKGYERDQFDDAFTRYLSTPPPVSATPLQPNHGAGLSVADRKSVAATPQQGNNSANCGGVADRGNVAATENENATPKPSNSAGCSGVADRAGKAGERTMREAEEDEREAFEERAAIMEYEGGLPREEAERLAREEIAGRQESCWWRVRFAGGRAVTVFSPPGNTRAGILKDYPEAVCAEAFTLEDTGPDAPMVGEEEAAVREWLIRLGNAFYK